MERTNGKYFGYCIYCGATSGKLTDEHAIPDAISGNIVLKKACCKTCQEIINPFEQRYLKNTYGLPRSILDLPRSRKSKRPSLSPTIGGVSVKAEDVLVPFIVVYPRHLPWIEEGSVKSFSKASDNVFFSTLSSWKLPNPDLLPNFRLDDHYRTIAKIAYSLTVYNYELPFKKSFITDFILGNSKDFRQFLGASREGGNASKLHSWSYDTIETRKKHFVPNQSFLRIKLTLFSGSMDFTFHVITRDISDEMQYITEKSIPSLGQPNGEGFEGKSSSPPGYLITSGKELPFSEKLEFEYNQDIRSQPKPISE